MEKKIDINLDNISQVFSGGQTITGKVSLDLKVPEQTTGVHLSCIGEVQVHWDEKVDTADEMTSSVQSSHEEKIFQFNTLLLGEGDGSNIQIPGVLKIFPFQFTLPAGIPNSFEGSYGSVKYYCEVKFKRLLFKKDYEKRIEFQVRGRLDLNQVKLPKHFEVKAEKRMCCLCCKSDPIGFALKLHRTGFAPRDSIEFMAELYNMTARKLPKSTLKLIQVANYHSKEKVVAKEDKTLVELIGPGLKSKENRVWTGELIVPNVPPSRLGSANKLIINVEYKLEMTLTIMGGKKLSDILPILIGTTSYTGSSRDWSTKAKKKDKLKDRKKKQSLESSSKHKDVSREQIIHRERENSIKPPRIESNSSSKEQKHEKSIPSPSPSTISRQSQSHKKKGGDHSDKSKKGKHDASEETKSKGGRRGKPISFWVGL